VTEEAANAKRGTWRGNPGALRLPGIARMTQNRRWNSVFRK
jgi:hypothetical protein